MADQEALQRAVVELTQRQQRRYYGKFRGIVTDNNDPDKQGRIRAKVPELFGTDETGWAIPCVPFAGDDHGLLALPETDSNVWIEFEAGDPSRPIFAGCWWPQSKMPQAVASPSVKVFHTKAGNKITLDDSSGSEKVTLEDKNGATITLDQQGILLKKGGQSVKVTDSQVAINDSALTVM
jgi:uncharacterized protein involved in type VI secretion and phage assembly